MMDIPEDMDLDAATQKETVESQTVSADRSRQWLGRLRNTTPHPELTDIEGQILDLENGGAPRVARGIAKFFGINQRSAAWDMAVGGIELVIQETRGLNLTGSGASEDSGGELKDRETGQEVRIEQYE